jgi:hypothetical protein
VTYVSRAAAIAATLCLALTARPAAAQPADDSSTTVKLIELLIKNGVITKQQADALLKQARSEAHTARAPQPNRAQTAATQPPAPAEAGAPVPPGTVRVTYVPEIVRQQIAAEVKQQVMQEAQEQGWAEPNQIPEWTQRIRLFGDVRVRGESALFGNTNSPLFVNFNAINNSPNGFDTSGTTLPPLLNTTENRNFTRLRARLGVDATIADWISSEIRIATGNDQSPISTNQTLGQPGDFQKYGIWLDRAFIEMRPESWLTFDVGRAPNPFWTTDLLFDTDLNFDGVSVQVAPRFDGPVSPFFNAGAFPVFNTDFNFGSNNIQKNASRNAYLLAAQAGAEWKISDNYVLKGGAGYFNFLNVEGSESAPCLNPTAFGSCNTDNTKPGFVTQGNTMFALRDIVQDPSNPLGPTPQYFGLASRFNLLDLHGALSILTYHPVDVVLQGDFVYNFGFNKGQIAGRPPVNNLGASATPGTPGPYVGGNTAFMIGATVGHQELEKLWDWNASLAYKYIESDALLDALTDSDFHLGGTNAKGYIVGANLALHKNVWLAFTWLSAMQVSGPTYQANLLLFDLNAKF